MLQKWHKCCFFVDFSANKGHAFTHGEGGQHSSDAKAGDMTEEKEGHAGCDDKTCHVVADFYFRIRFSCDIFQLTRE